MAIGLYLAACIEKQRVCFEYARKWRPKRMVHSKLMLPVKKDGTPDYEYMEAYMKNIEAKQKQAYLAFKQQNA